MLANTSDSPLAAELTLYESSGKAWRQALKLGARQTMRLSIRSLVQRGGLAGSFGGISVEASGRAADLDSAHFVYDETTGFLALMKMFDRNADATLSQRSLTHSKWTIRAPMLPLTYPDPALNLPAGTALKPTIFLRNASAAAYTTQITFNWRSGTTTGKATTSVPLEPRATTVLDVAALQANNTIPASAQWAYVSIAAPIKPDNLLAVATSFDASGRLGAQTPFTDQVANHWEGGMWEVDPNHDTIIAVGNAGDAPSKARVTFYFNSGQGRYEIERTLAPDEQAWLDVGKLIRNQMADVNGTTIPVSVTAGSYELENLTDKSRDGLFEGKLVVDKTYGYAAHGCASCCPEYDPISIVQDPLNLSVGGSSNQSVQGVNLCTNKSVQVAALSWDTGDHNVATVDASGQVTGRGGGSTTDIATFRVWYPDSRGYCRSSTAPVSGNLAVGGPHHLIVISDVTSVACTTNSTVRRIIKYWEVDANGNQIGTISTKEHFASKGPNSCNTTISTSETCAPDAGGQLQDAIFVGCNSVGGSCGTTFTKQQWLYCPSTGIPVVFATPGDLVIHNNSILVGGSSRFPTGTRIGPNGVF